MQGKGFTVKPVPTTVDDQIGAKIKRKKWAIIWGAKNIRGISIGVEWDVWLIFHEEDGI